MHRLLVLLVCAKDIASLPCRSATRLVLEFERAISRLIDKLDLESRINSYISIVDLGAADGVNSFQVIEQFSRALMKRRNPLALMVSHVDLPTADRSGLARNIDDRDRGYRHSLAAEGVSIHSAVVPGSFYNSFLPAQSVDILFSTTALHYASKCASTLTGHVHSLYPTGDAETTAWASLSETDLQTAMSNIHGCLRAGGKFWAVVPGHSQDESTGKIRNYWYREVLEVMCEQLRSLVKTGVVDEATWNNFVLPVHQRHLNQWQVWFARNDSMFHLDFLYGEDQTNPYLQRLRNDHKDPDRFADEYLSSVRAWSDKIITQILPDDEQRNKFFEGLRRQFKQDPERFDYDTYSVYIGATRL